jgi:hypothetical protein
MLDVVTVQVFCDSWDVRARVPAPRLHLLAKQPRPTQGSSHQKPQQQTKITSKLLQANQRPHSQIRHQQAPVDASSHTLSVYEQIQSIKIVPILPKVPFRTESSSSSKEKATNRVESIKGRLSFGGFINPDTRTATQQAAMAAASEAAAQRRANVVIQQNRQSEYSTSSNAERAATARMQRIAAEKRNTRKQKSKS